jgi:hypothetical protein
LAYIFRVFVQIKDVFGRYPAQKIQLGRVGLYAAIFFSIFFATLLLLTNATNHWAKKNRKKGYTLQSLTQLIPPFFIAQFGFYEFQQKIAYKKYAL